MTYNKSVLLPMETVRSFDVGMGKISSIKVRGTYSVHFKLLMNVKYVKCVQESVLYIPNSSYNLPPVGVINPARNYVSFDSGNCEIEINVKIIAEDQQMKDLYIPQTISKATKAGDEVPLVHNRSS